MYGPVVQKGQDVIGCGQSFGSRCVKMVEPTGTPPPGKFDIIPKENKIDNACLWKGKS